MSTRHDGHKRSHLTFEQRDLVVKFIQEHHSEYDSKYGCLKAALESAGCAGKIAVNANAVWRYFDRAGIKTTRKSKQDAERPKRAEVQQIQINYCPRCGCDLHAVAVGMAQSIIC